MIEKERLQELIDKGATIWCMYCGEIKLNKEEFYIDNVEWDNKTFMLIKNLEYENYHYLYELFETEEESEFAYKEEKWKRKMFEMRTETFEPPTWEEFKKIEIYPYVEVTTDFNFLGKNHQNYTLYLVDNKEQEIGLSNKFAVLKTWKATEENYINAVEYCRKLFLGEEENETTK